MYRISGNSASIQKLRCVMIILFHIIDFHGNHDIFILNQSPPPCSELTSFAHSRFKFDREETVNLKDEEFDINMLTGFLKLFLRELPEPVIPFCQYPIVEQAIS